MFLQLISDEPMQLRIRIRDGICKVNSLIPLGEVILELQLEILPIKPISAISLHIVHLITVFLLPLASLHEFIRLQAFSIEILAFAEVAKVELHLSCEVFVVDFEVVPASVALSIGIASEKEVKLVLLDPHSHV